MTPRQELKFLRARYDGGAVSPAVYAVIRSLEIEVAWSDHENDERARATRSYSPPVAQEQEP
jgi:hypothetical protein